MYSAPICRGPADPHNLSRHYGGQVTRLLNRQGLTYMQSTGACSCQNIRPKLDFGQRLGLLQAIINGLLDYKSLYLKCCSQRSLHRRSTSRIRPTLSLSLSSIRPAICLKYLLPSSFDQATKEIKPWILRLLLF